jgi:hypothetical protein
MTAASGSDSVMVCTGCGASVYREHIDRGLAGRWAGQLLCPHCLAEKKRPVTVAAAASSTPAVPPPDEDHLAMADEAEGAAHPSRSSTFAGFAGLNDPDSMVYQRPLLPAGMALVECASFTANCPKDRCCS